MIKILYEDNHLLVVEKPVNILSQGDDTGDENLLDILKGYIKDKYNKPGDVYLGLVHRLDRPVGGVMVFARTSKAASRLSEQIRQRGFKKTYLAVAHGMITKPQGRLEHYLVKDNKSNTVYVASQNTEGAKDAILDYKVLDYRVLEYKILDHKLPEYKIPGNTQDNGNTRINGNTQINGNAREYGLSLFKINLHTGRPHQIRVQFSAAGHPLYGDQKYGAEMNKPGQQIALWSSEIACMHPALKDERVFKCPPPDVYPWNLFKNSFF